MAKYNGFNHKIAIIFQFIHLKQNKKLNWINQTTLEFLVLIVLLSSVKRENSTVFSYTEKKDILVVWSSKHWFTLWKWNQMRSISLYSESRNLCCNFDTKITGLMLKMLVLDLFQHLWSFVQVMGHRSFHRPFNVWPFGSPI